MRENPPAPAHTDGLMTPLSFDVTDVAQILAVEKVEPKSSCRRKRPSMCRWRWRSSGLGP